MALTELVIDETYVGQVIGPPDAFLVNLTMTTRPAGYEIPQWDEGRMRWLTSYFVLKGTGDTRDIFSACPEQGGVFGGFWLGNASLPYRGQLQVVACPKGSEWAVSISDIPFIKTPDTGWWSTLGAKIIPAPREAVSVR